MVLCDPKSGGRDCFKKRANRPLLSQNYKRVLLRLVLMLFGECGSF